MSTLISENKQHVTQKASIILPGVDMVGIINDKGRLVDSFGTGSFNMPQGKIEMFLMGMALQTSMQKDFNEDFGEVNYNITQRDSTKFISVPIHNGNTILAVAKKDVDHENVVAGINQLLRYSKEFLGKKIAKDGGSTY